MARPTTFSRLAPLAAAVLLALAGCGAGPMAVKKGARGLEGRNHGRVSAATLEDRIAETAEQTLEAHDIPGLSIALVDPQGATWTGGFGYADRAAGRPATEATIYRAGSLAKLFTATAVMQLAAAGRIDLDRPVADYLPAFAVRQRFPDARAITVRDLLTHHSGLPCDLTKGMWSKTPYVQAARAVDEVYTAYPPGQVFSYSNLGYSVLGRLVESVGGAPYQMYLREHVLAPLGMAETAFRPYPVGTMAAGYRHGERGRPLPMRDLPALGLHTNARDLAGLLRMVLAEGRGTAGPVLPRAALADMLAPQNEEVPLDFDLRVGLGWFLDDRGLERAGVVARHSGTTPLYSSEVIVLPEHDLAVAVLSNRGDARPAVTGLAEEVMRLALAARRGITLPADGTHEPVQVADQALPAGIGGRYATELGIVELQPHKRLLRAVTLDATFDMEPYGGASFRLRPRSGAGRLAGLDGLRIGYRRVEGREVLAVYQRGHAHPFGIKVDKAPVSPAWRNRLGRYELTNPDPEFPIRDLCLLRDDGVLYLEYRLPTVTAQTIRVPVQAVDHDLAVTLGLGRTRGEALRISRAGGSELLHFSGYTARRVN